MQKLDEFKGEILDDQARILADCYGVDLYRRMLLDIPAVYDAEADEQHAPTFRRLEMAEAICTGYTFPTNHYLVTRKKLSEKEISRSMLCLKTYQNFTF